MGSALSRCDRDLLGSRWRRAPFTPADQSHQQAIVRMDDSDDRSGRRAHSGGGAGNHCDVSGRLFPGRWAARQPIVEGLREE